MTPDRLRKARDLVTAALNMNPPDREDFLRSETQGDDELLEETLLLLDDGDDATQLLDESPRKPQVFDEAYLAGKKQIGNYRLIRRVGQGGMGMVYAACLVTEDFQRQVALKLVKPSLASSLILRRFRMERQLLASLDHPNIARLLDAGSTEEGAPYLVMEFVEGLPIDRFCESQNLSINERLRLFLTVCDAVQYAHQNLIIHRDLKPSNILISSEGAPKLLDFGIAKLIRPEDAPDEMKLTATDSRPMSPHYASPEQARGETITTASDIYSLGVLLYELLTGKLPYEFRQRSAAAIEKTICETHPVPPSEVDFKEPLPEPAEKLRKRLRGDLDMILLMAMRKEPARRYSSVHQFAEDIRRQLQGQTVIAQKDTVQYRVSKFVKRHTAGVIAASLAVLALVTSTIVSVHFAQVATQEKRVAERRFRESWSLARFIITDFDDAIRTSQTDARRMLVTKGVESLQRLSTEAGNDQDLMRDVIRGYLAMGDVQGNPTTPNIGDNQGARSSYTEALNLSERAGPAFVSEHQKARLRIADLDVVDGNRKAALETYLSILPTLKGSERAYALRRMGFAYMQLGRLQESVKVYRDAMDLMFVEMQKDPKNDSYREDYAEAAERLGDVYSRLRDYDGAIVNLQKAMGIHEQMGGIESSNPEVTRATWACSSLLADAFKNRGNLAEAEGLQRANLAIAESLLRRDPNNTQYTRGRIVTLSRLADILAQMPGRQDEARHLTMRGLTYLKPLVEVDRPKSYDLQTYIWILLHTPFTDLRRPAEVLTYAEKWLDQVGSGDAQAIDTVAQAAFLNGDTARALRLEERALSLLPAGADSDLRTEIEDNLKKFRAAAAKQPHAQKADSRE